MVRWFTPQKLADTTYQCQFLNIHQHIKLVIELLGFYRHSERVKAWAILFLNSLQKRPAKIETESPKMLRLEGMLEVTEWKYCGRERWQECHTASYRQRGQDPDPSSPGHHSLQSPKQTPKKQAKDSHCFHSIVKEVNFPILKMKHLIFTMTFLKLRSRWVKNFPSISWKRATSCFTWDFQMGSENCSEQVKHWPPGNGLSQWGCCDTAP